MQKLLALLMLATVLFSVSACGDRPDDQAEQFPPTVYDDIAGGSPAPDNNSAGEAPIPSEQLRGSEKHDIPATPYDEMVETGASGTRTAFSPTGRIRAADNPEAKMQRQGERRRQKTDRSGRSVFYMLSRQLDK